MAAQASAQIVWGGKFGPDTADPGNWVGTFPGAGDDVTFGIPYGSSDPLLYDATGFHSLIFNNADPYAFGGNRPDYSFSSNDGSVINFTLGGDIDVQTAPGNINFDYRVGFTLTSGVHNFNLTGVALEIDGNITGSGASINQNGGSLTLGGTSDFDGGVTVNSGTLYLNNSSYDDGGIHGPLGSGTLTLMNQATLSVTSDGTTVLHNDIALDSSSSANVFVYLPYGNLDLLGVISGGSALLAQGPGTLTLSGTNTFTGPLSISGGSTVSVATDNNLGATPGSPVGNLLQFNSGTLETTSDMTINSNRGIFIDSAGGTLSPDSGTTLTYGGIISGSGQLTMSGQGTLNLSGTSTYTGGTLVFGNGVIIAANDSALGTGPLSFDSESEGAVEFTTTSPVIGGLSGGFTDYNSDGQDYFGSLIELDAGTTLTINQASDSSYEGMIIGPGGLIKTGSGTLTLDGSSSYTNSSGNSYSGGTAVNGGTLVAAANNVLGTGAVAVNNTGTLMLKNSASLNNTVTVNSGGKVAGTGTIATGSIESGGILSPGSVSGCPIGSLTFNDLTIKGGGIYEWNTKDATGTTDQVFVENTQTLTIAATSSNKFTLRLISLDSSDTLGGTATGFTAGQTYQFTIFSTNGITGFDPNAFAIDSSQFFVDASISAQPASTFSVTQVGNDIVLNFTPVPEPSTYALMGLGLGAVMFPVLLRRRRA